MYRPTLYCEAGGVPAGVLADVLAVVGVTITPERIGEWTPMERALACDWATRIHLHASDWPARLRPKPSFVTAAEEGLS